MPPVNIVVAESPARVSAVRDLFLEYGASLGDDLDHRDFDRAVEELPGAYQLPRGCLLLGVRDDGRPIACVAVRPLDDACCEMQCLYVRPEARGFGLGRRLAEAAIDFGRSAGYATMRLDTLRAMSAAQALYRHLGFREIPPYRESPVPGNLFMELTLLEGGPNE